MSYSLPVISTDEGAILEILDNNSGIIVPKQDHIVLATEMEYLINNPNKASELSVKGRKRYEELYTQKAFEKMFLGVIEKILLT